MQLRCPTCDRPILSRRNKLCGFCQEPLPAELIFSAEKVQAIEAEERARALARQLRDEERAQKARAAGMGDGGGGGFGGGF